MEYNKELPDTGVDGLALFRGARPAGSKLQAPQITIRGDNNLISFGTSGVLKVNAEEAAQPDSRPERKRQWPQQILDAIRIEAAKARRSNDDVCELAARVLGRAVVTLERLSARELVRVYEAICSHERKPS